MKKKNLCLFCIIIAMLFLFLVMLCTYSKASDAIDDPNSFRPVNITTNDTEVITGKANQIIGAITTVGVVIAVITLTILGIKYMIGSVEEKAEYKKSMVPYIIGSILLFASSAILGIIGVIMEGINF